MEVKIFEDKLAVADAFCAHFKAQLKGKDQYHIALSGGSTPKIVFDVLAQNYGSLIDWSKVHFYWGDERCVPPTDAQSNYKMTVDHLLSKISIPSENIHRIIGEAAPTREAMRYANLLEINLDRVGGIPQFDMVLLGMGDDGHTASIFPHQMDLWEAADHCVVATHPTTGQQRVSINGSIINNAKEVAFLVTGANKAEKFAAIQSKKEGYKAYPAALVQPTSGQLQWFLDQAAAGES